MRKSVFAKFTTILPKGYLLSFYKHNIHTKKMQTVAIPQEEPGLFEKAGEYAETQLLLFKYKAVDTGAEVISSLMAKLAVVMLLATFLLILSIGLALWIGYLLGQSYYGFLIVAGVYGLAALLLHSLGDQLIKQPVTDAIIRKILK